MARTLDKLISDQKPEIVKNARKKADDMVLGIHLAQLRERMKVTQEDIAKTLGVKQPTIAGMERKGRDVKLSTLKRYVEGAGGKLTVNVELPDGSHYGFNL
ncbi:MULTISPECIES: helix-turn-helix domain-containing protein [Marinomonas]|uniref:Helix-turn-helix transcriptional regulator n=1 Tax=Marinomonas arctica TaxID=383750 RepID=A0A7H1J7Y3_9GAMM|nr:MULTISPECIES: helix-turn-helix transcriptional regulator [Marinomonas]MCS7488647.1 Cro/Cl family transcriptional regulator [Marinomonas sp. BSi20414]QNT06599.1 helix-turn-helix transcriptional regulator [Marinomonas arctica]GGN39362.1 transcriptional regulator [Marinomonas arctica]